MTEPQTIIDVEWEQVAPTKPKAPAKLQKLGGADIDAIINAAFGLMFFAVILYFVI